MGLLSLLKENLGVNRVIDLSCREIFQNRNDFFNKPSILNLSSLTLIDLRKKGI